MYYNFIKLSNDNIPYLVINGIAIPDENYNQPWMKEYLERWGEARNYCFI